MNGTVLVAGVGNPFFGDDAFGVEVVRELNGRTLPEGVKVMDFGIRGMHLACELMDPPDLLLIADATRRGGAPGTLYVLEPEETSTNSGSGAADAHGMDLNAVFQLLDALGVNRPTTRIIGCEPSSLEECMQLSDPVKLAIVAAVEMICRMLNHEEAVQ